MAIAAFRNRAADSRWDRQKEPRARWGSRTRCRPLKRVSARQLSPLYPQLRTFRQRCPLSCRLRLLYPQEQTLLVVSPKVAGPVIGSQLPKALNLTLGNIQELIAEGEARNGWRSTPSKSCARPWPRLSPRPCFVPCSQRYAPYIKG